jgi:hypothetical protein
MLANLKKQTELQPHTSTVTLNTLIIILLATALPTASGQTITPLYGNTTNYWAGEILPATIAPIPPQTSTPTAVTAVCAITGPYTSTYQLQVTVWNDNGAEIASTASYTQPNGCAELESNSNIGTIGSFTIGAASINANVFATAVMGSSGLQVQAWQINGGGTSVTPLGAPALDESVVPAFISMADLDATRVVTLVGYVSPSTVVSPVEYKMTVWQIPSSSSGAVTAQNSTYPASFPPSNYNLQTVAIANYSSSQVVTADIDASEHVRVTMWSINSAGDFTMQNWSANDSESEGPQVVAAPETNTVTTSSIDYTGQLELITWTIGGGGSVTRQYTATEATDSFGALALIPYTLYPFAWQQGSNNVLDALVFGPSSSSPFGQIAADHTGWSDYTPVAATGTWEYRVATLAEDTFTNFCDGEQCPLQLEVWDFSQP